MTKTKNPAAGKVQTKATRTIYKRFKEKFPDLPDEVEEVVYQYLPGAIRVRIIHPSFAGKSFGERELSVADVLTALGEEIEGRITLLILMTPEEAKKQSRHMSRVFDDPTGERL